jgi:dienelactone hydrolase
MNTPLNPFREAAALRDIRALESVPRVFESKPVEGEGVQSLFYESVPWRGKPTRVFAYCGVPDAPAGERVPGMVLVHGGGGSAFIRWVKLWMSRGYAAIAMDTCGCVSGGGHQNHTPHEHGGPRGWGGFDQLDEPLADQWPCHAAAAVIRGHSLLRSLPRVDPGRIGLTGVSWGGYLTAIVAGLDARFRLAAPVYGCGFLGDNSTWLDEFRKMGQEPARRWLGLWDPAVYLPKAVLPMVWVTGTNDFAYPLDSWQKSYRLAPGGRTLSLRVRMPHGHGGPGENPPEILAAADALFRGGAPLARITGAARDGRRVRVCFESRAAVVRAELNVTTDTGPWLDRNWRTEPAVLEAAGGAAAGELPEGAAAWYLNLVDERGCVVSSEHEAFSSSPGPAITSPIASNGSRA